MGCGASSSNANRIKVVETEVASLRKQLHESEKERGQLQQRLLEANTAPQEEGGSGAGVAAASGGAGQTRRAEEEAAADRTCAPAEDEKPSSPRKGDALAHPASDSKASELSAAGDAKTSFGDAIVMTTGSTVASDTAIAGDQDPDATAAQERAEAAPLLPGAVPSKELDALPETGEQPDATAPPPETDASEEEPRDANESGIETAVGANVKACRDLSSTGLSSTFADTADSAISASAQAAQDVIASASSCIQCGVEGEKLWLDSTDMNRYCSKCWADFYGEPPASRSAHVLQHLVTVEVGDLWQEDNLSQLWSEGQLPGWPPPVQPLTVPAATEPEVWTKVTLQLRRDVVGPHARETIQGDRPYNGEVLAGKYRVGRSVGEGHFTKAFLAEDTSTGTSVCLKRHRSLTVEALADLMVLGRRMDEVDLTGRLFPKLLDAFYDLVGYTVETLVEGKNCLAVLQRDKTFFQDLTNLQVVAHGGLNGLSYLDRAGVVHNDVKPDNIIWIQAPSCHGRPMESSSVQIVDFGCARLDQREDCGRNWSLAEGGAGHLGKWSPEMTLRLPITTRGDVWGIAVSLCELHCGRFVWHSEADTAEVVLAQALGLCGQRDGVPSSLLRRSPLDIRVLYTPAPLHLPLRRNGLGQLEALRPRHWGLEQVLGEGWRENGKAALGEFLQAALIMDPADRPSARQLLQTCGFAEPPSISNDNEPSEA